MKRIQLVVASAALLLLQAARAQQPVVDELLAADRAYSAASAKTDVISGLSAMFAEGVIMPTPARQFADGIAKATEALRANPANARSKIEWTPIRGGVSADGLHGFTFGYMTLHDPDSGDAPLKYLSYWVKEGGAWKVAAYKRSRRPVGAVSMTLLTPALPPKIIAPTNDRAVIDRFAKSLADAEQAFSDESAVIGLGAAFAKYGSADAMNMGRNASFTFGNVEIGNGVSGANPNEPSPLTWKSDYRVIVASSGDLGVSIGFIRQKSDPAAPAAPFFTIWRRASANDPWRYVAE